MYLSALCPTIFHNDSPEFVNTAFTLGISHPAGFPAYNLFAKAITFIPLGSVAFKVNLFAAIAACLTLVFMYLAGIRLLEVLHGKNNSGAYFFAAILPVGILAFCKPFWFNALQAEVYTLHALFTCLIFWLLLSWPVEKDVRYLFGAALVFGLSAGNHATVAFYLPAILVLFFCWNKEDKVKNLSLCVGFFLVGLSVYLYLPIRSLAEPSFDWGNPETLKGFIYQVTDRKDSHSHFSSLRNASGVQTVMVDTAPILRTAWQSLVGLFGEIWKPIRFFLADINTNFSPVSVIGFMVGAVICMRASFPLFLFFMIIVAVNIVFFIGWGKESFFPSYVTTTLFTVALIHFILSRLEALRDKNLANPASFFVRVNCRRIIITGLMLLICWLAILNFIKVDRSENYQAESLYQRIYLTLEDRSIFVPGLSWFHYYYFQDVARLRDDVTSISVWDLLSPNPPTMVTKRRYPDLKLPDSSRYDFASEENISRYIYELFERNSISRPVLLEQCWTFYEHTLLTGNFVPFKNILLKYVSEGNKDGSIIPNRYVFDEYKLFLEDELKEMNKGLDINWVTLPTFFLESFSMYYYDTERYPEQRQVMDVIFNFLGKKYSSEWNFKLLDNLVKDNKLVEAERVMEFLLTKFPGKFETFLAEGIMQRAGGDIDASLNSFKKAADQFPDRFRPRFEMAISHLAKGDESSSESEFKAALQRVKNLRDFTALRKVSPS